MDKKSVGKALLEAAYLEGDFVLRSGRRSRYYLDKFRFETRPDLLGAIGDRIAAAVQPDESQRGALDALREASISASASLKADCPTYQALTPVGRTEAMEQRLDAMLHAVDAVQPALAKFYGSLSDEQKERFNRLPPGRS